MLRCFKRIEFYLYLFCFSRIICLIYFKGVEIMVKINEHNGLVFKRLVNLTGLGNNVVQNILFNRSSNMQYALQYRPFLSEPDIYRSTHENVDFWDNATTDDNVSVSDIHFDRLINFSSPLGGHTQTLMQDPFFIVTGLKNIVFDNLLSILSNATDQEKADFFKDALDTQSWQEFNKAYLHSHKSPNVKTESINWDMDFLALPNKLASTSPVEGQYINIVGTHTLVAKGKRSELAESPDRQHLLLSVVDTDNQLHLYVFRANLFDDLNLKYTDITDNLAINWDGHGFPIASSVGSDLRVSALSFYHALLDANDLFYDLSTLPQEKHYTFSQSEILSKIGSSDDYFSYQGFAVDNNSNIYISSGKAPEYKNNKLIEYPFYICKIYDDSFDFMDAKLNLTTLSKTESPEIEGLQALSTNHLLVAYSIHDTSSFNLTVSRHIVYEVEWATA